jgi:hypothetical protein
MGLHGFKSSLKFLLLGLAFFSLSSHSIQNTEDTEKKEPKESQNQVDVSLTEAETAKNRLQTQIDLIEAIDSWFQKQDLATLYLLKTRSQNTLDSIRKNGLSHKTTFQLFQKLIRSYRRNRFFLEQNAADVIETKVSKLLKITGEIAEAHGFDDSPYTKQTLDIFTEMRGLLIKLKTDYSLTDDVLKELNTLDFPFGKTLAAADAGDRPKAFEQGIPLCKKIISLYSVLQSIQVGDDAHNIVMLIMGLNEDYARLAQIYLEK